MLVVSFLRFFEQYDSMSQTGAKAPIGVLLISVANSLLDSYFQKKKGVARGLSIRCCNKNKKNKHLVFFGVIKTTKSEFSFL